MPYGTTQAPHPTTPFSLESLARLAYTLPFLANIQKIKNNNNKNAAMGLKNVEEKKNSKRLEECGLNLRECFEGRPR